MPITGADTILEDVQDAILDRLSGLTAAPVDPDTTPPALSSIIVAPFNASPESVADALGRFADKAPVGILSWPTVSFSQEHRAASSQVVELRLTYLFATINETLDVTSTRRATLFREFGVIAPAVTDLLISEAGELPDGWASLYLNLESMTPHDAPRHAVCIYTITAVVKSKAVYRV